MKVHSVEGLKAKARDPRFKCVLSCAETGAAQTLQGVTVTVENTSITCIYQSHVDAYVWMAGGQFVDEPDVLAFLDHKPTPVPLTIAESLAKFDAYRAGLLPALATRVELEGREQHETLVRLSEQWGVLYYGPEGYTRMQELAANGGGALPPQMLAEKMANAETALLAVADSFVRESARVKL